MKKIKDFDINILMLIGLMLLGFLIGIVFGVDFVQLDDAGAFGGGSWKRLESPLKFKHISSATTLTIWATTEENKLYKQRYCLSDANCNQWVESKEVFVDPLEENELETINKYTCTPRGFKYPLDPHGRVLECALATRYRSLETKNIVYYALLDDGTIWVWSSSGPLYFGLGMYMILVAPIVGSVLGLLIYRGFRKYQHNKRV